MHLWANGFLQGLRRHTGDTAQQSVVSSELLSASYSEETLGSMPAKSPLGPCLTGQKDPSTQAHTSGSDHPLAAGDLGQVVNLFMFQYPHI